MKKQLIIIAIWAVWISTGCAKIGVEIDRDESDTDSASNADSDSDADIDADSDTDTDTDVDTDTDTDSDLDTDSDSDADSDTDTTCECSSGDCCDGCNFLPATTQCDTVAASYEYQCSSSECGADAQRRGIFRHCSGIYPNCPADNYQPGEWETTEDCSPGQTCIVEGESSYCYSCLEGCTDGNCDESQCTTGACCDDEQHYRPSTFQCSTTPESIEYGCTNSDCGGDAQSREQHRFCTGSSADCTDANLQWSDWQTLDTCEVEEACDYNEADAWCDVCVNGCQDGACCECSSGACCDGCSFLSDAIQCDATPASTQYQCTDSSCGADLERRYQYKYCNGSSAICDTTNLQWGAWSAFQNCSTDQLCNAGSGTCDTCTNGCQSGSCCECSTGACCDGCNFSPNTLQCDATSVSTEYQCTGTACGSDLQRRRQYKYCTGTSATCGITNLQWETWSTHQSCSTDQLCNAGLATCDTCTNGCQSGSCCECSSGECCDGCDFYSNGTECGARYCSSLDYYKQTCQTGVCSGSQLIESCGDSDWCTDDSCSSSSGCSNDYWGGAPRTASGASSTSAATDPANLIDCSPSTSWSSQLHTGTIGYEWFAFWFGEFRDVTSVTLYPRKYLGNNQCVPEYVNIYYSGPGPDVWTFIVQEDLAATIPQGYTINFGSQYTNGLLITTDRLRADDFGGYYFQMAEVFAGP